jgi:CheY-like chemotaxis protein
MPVMDGRALAKRLESPHPDIKVLCMSRYAENAIVHRGVLEEGMNYIQKPLQ